MEEEGEGEDSYLFKNRTAEEIPTFLIDSDFLLSFFCYIFCYLLSD